MDAEARRAKAQWVETKLEEFYGSRPYDPAIYESDLLGALIATILSQHTSDLNSGRAYAALKAAYPMGWDYVRAAPVEQIADAIRCGGLAAVKAARIKRLLQDICARTGATHLDFLRDLTSDEEIALFLTSFHGVGPKTAACILLFNLGRPAIPVDTHVHRVSRRIGLVGPKADAVKTQNELKLLVAPSQAYSFHVHLIEHGRRICHAQRPSCGRCPVSARCCYFQLDRGIEPEKGAQKRRTAA
ncbi:MAG TPA: hypothetical protein VFW40_08125 [Capsulimonadaceae bacterium]|nr:hypothetical protein [Capsulimonadaceae bacterium]